DGRVDRLFDHQVLAVADRRKCGLTMQCAWRRDGDRLDLGMSCELLDVRSDERNPMILRKPLCIFGRAARDADDLRARYGLDRASVKRRNRARPDNTEPDGSHGGKNRLFPTLRLGCGRSAVGAPYPWRALRLCEIQS